MEDNGTRRCLADRSELRIRFRSYVDAVSGRKSGDATALGRRTRIGVLDA